MSSGQKAAPIPSRQRISLEERVDAFRLGAGWDSLANLCQALSGPFFCEATAKAALDKHKQAWLENFHDLRGIFAYPWCGRHDAGQASNEHVAADKGHPLLAACRWGGASAVEWICRQEDVELVVSFRRTASVNMFGLAGANGQAEVMEPLWNAACAAGATEDEKAEAVATWLAGVASADHASQEEAAEKIRAARRPLSELLAKNPGLKLPVASREIFATAMEAAIYHCEDNSIVVELLDLGVGIWAHPRSLGVEGDYDHPDPPSDFIEEALCAGNAKSLASLASAGFALPSPERSAYLAGTFSSADRSSEALTALQEQWALAERVAICSAAAEPKRAASRGPRAL